MRFAPGTVQDGYGPGIRFNGSVLGDYANSISLASSATQYLLPWRHPSLGFSKAARSPPVLRVPPDQWEGDTFVAFRWNHEWGDLVVACVSRKAVGRRSRFIAGRREKGNRYPTKRPPPMVSTRTTLASYDLYGRDHITRNGIVQCLGWAPHALSLQLLVC